MRICLYFLMIIIKVASAIKQILKVNSYFLLEESLLYNFKTSVNSFYIVSFTSNFCHFIVQYVNLVNFVVRIAYHCFWNAGRLLQNLHLSWINLIYQSGFKVNSSELFVDEVCWQMGDLKYDFLIIFYFKENKETEKKKFVIKLRGFTGYVDEVCILFVVSCLF
jgi:hypothetical protein